MQIYLTKRNILGTCWCEKLPENLQNLQEKLAASVSLDEVQEALKTKCEKNGGPDAFDKLEVRRLLILGFFSCRIL